MREGLTEIIQIRKPLTEQQKVEMLAEISRSNDKIAELELDLDDLKEKAKPLKKAQDTERDNIAMVLANYKAGSIPENVKCSIRYEKGMTKYYAVESGELVEEHPTSEEEQLRMSENRIDAEQIIRQASQEE